MTVSSPGFLSRFQALMQASSREVPLRSSAVGKDGVADFASLVLTPQKLKETLSPDRYTQYLRVIEDHERLTPELADSGHKIAP